MKREQLIFLSAGLVFGFVLGFAIAWGMGNAPASTGMPASAPRTVQAPMTGSGAGDEGVMEEVQTRMADLTERIERDPGDVQALTELGNFYMQAQMFVEARDYLERAVDASPDDLHALTHLGIVLGQMGDLASARVRFERAVELDPHYWEGWYYLAATVVRLGDLEAARGATARVEELNPTLPEIADLKRSLAEAQRGSP